jgi:hypothetical protein
LQVDGVELGGIFVPGVDAVQGARLLRRVFTGALPRAL